MKKDLVIDLALTVRWEDGYEQPLTRYLRDRAIHARPWLRLAGRRAWRWHRRDLAGQVIWVCTRCGCHYVGERCPSGRH